MRKEELRKLRSLPATREMMQKGKEKVKRKFSWSHKWREESKYDALLRVQNLKGIIKAAVFLPADMEKGIKTPRYEIFINQDGQEWITRELNQYGEEVRWMESMYINLPELSYSASKYGENTYLNRDGINTFNRLPLQDGKNAKGVYRLILWQKQIRSQNIEQKEKREQKPWNEDMALVPEITPGFMEWMRRDVCQDVYIIYHYEKKGAKIGYCSRCRKMVPIKSPHHGEKTKCPACRANAEFKADGRIKTLATNNYYGEIIQKIRGGIVVRRFMQRQWYRCMDYKKPNIDTKEEERILILDNGTIRRYEWGTYKNKYQRWILDKYYIAGKRTYYWTSRIKLYKRNLPILKKTALKRSSIDLWEELPVGTVDYLQIEKGNPAVEMLARIGMFRLARDIIKMAYDRYILDHEQTELSKLLRIDKARLKRLKDMDGGKLELEWMQMEKLQDTIWPDEMILDMGKAMIIISDLNFLPTPIDHQKAWRYMRKQSDIANESLHQTMITWRDYVNMAEQMKMNTRNEQILKPKNLKEAHDRLILMNKSKTMEKKAKELEKKWPKVNGNLPKLSKFEFEYGEYCIMAPKGILDIVKEGEILGHCVHTCDYYFSRIQTDESYLFFLRKKCSPDMPWYTLEVEPSGNIRQKRTTGDKQNPDFKNAIPFLKKWQQYFKKQLTKEEKELGDKANQLREENYKKLRENQNKVWHGPLAGQLLADVLEADFMEAI